MPLITIDKYFGACFDSFVLKFNYAFFELVAFILFDIFFFVLFVCFVLSWVVLYSM